MYYESGPDSDVYCKKSIGLLTSITNAKQALLEHSCKAALEVAVILIDIQPGDEVMRKEMNIKFIEKYKYLFICIMLLYAFYCLFYIFCINRSITSDFYDHLGLVFQYFNKSFFSALMADVEPGLHSLVYLLAKSFQLITHYPIGYSVSSAMSFVMAVSKVAVFIFLYRCLFRAIQSKKLALLLSLALLVISTPWIPIINNASYLVIGSPSLYHNPTFILMVPFSLYFYHCIVGNYEDTLTSKRAWYLAFILLICSSIKPAFTYVMILSFLIYYLCHLKKMKKNTLSYLYIVIPAIIYMVYQYYLVSQFYGSGKIIFAPFISFYHFTQHPILCIVQAIFLPLSLTILCVKRLGWSILSDELILAWVFYAISFMLFAFIKESADFCCNIGGWSYMMGLILIYFYSIRDYIVMLQNKTEFYLADSFVFVLFCICVASGVIRLLTVYLGHSYAVVFS